MHVYLTGATGFVGGYVLQALRDAGHTVRCLIRDPKAKLPVEGTGVERVKGDILKPKTLAGTIRGCDAVIHLVGIIEEKPDQGITFDRIHYDGTKHVVDQAREAGVDRFIQMSANGAREHGVSGYQRSKWKAEQYVQKAGFGHWTIFRPSLVFGDPGPDNPEFATQIARDLIRPFPILPVFGDGKYRMQPIAVEAVAAAFVQALTTEAAHGQIYCAAGPETFPYTEILDIITRGCGLEPKPKLPQPAWLVRPVIQLAGVFNLLPISIDQFEMLLEGNTCDSNPFDDDFSLTHIPFTPENLAYLRA